MGRADDVFSRKVSEPITRRSGFTCTSDSSAHLFDSQESSEHPTLLLDTVFTANTAAYRIINDFSAASGCSRVADAH
jgi:hypothetical protein